MDQVLRCNNQVGGYCRAPLTNVAIVTTCSHIFCQDCAAKTGLEDASPQQRQCPICQTALPDRDDAVKTVLKPSDAYRTSVLSGLDPATIMECAGRALTFWTYQTSQEIVYQEYIGKSLRDKYGQLSTAMDKLVNEANSEIQNLHDKYTGLSLDHDALQQKHHELKELTQEKTRRMDQVQKMYDLLKSRVQRRNAQTAASEDVSHTLDSITGCMPPPSVMRHTEHSNPTTANRKFDNLHAKVLQPQPQHSYLPNIGNNSNLANNRGLSNATDTFPPLRTTAANRLGSTNPAASRTPLYRTTLSGVDRPVATRPQHPSNKNEDITEDHIHFRHSAIPRSGTKREQNRNNFGQSAFNHNSTPSTYGGISRVMKIGRVGTAGEFGEGYRGNGFKGYV